MNISQSSYLMTLSRPYAQAAFDFAYENKVLDKWELMFISAKNIIQDEVIILLLLGNVDYLEPASLADMVILIGNHAFDCFFQNFIRLLAEYKRLCLLPFIFKEFLILCRQQALVIKLKIITARVLRKWQALKIVSIVQKQFFYSDNKKVDITFKLDRSIIGGFYICFNDTVIDGSIKGRIERLRNSMLGIY